MRWTVVVPDVMVDELLVPDHLAGLDIETDDGTRIEIGARPMSAVEIVRSGFDVQVDVAQFFIRENGPQTPVLPV